MQPPIRFEPWARRFRQGCTAALAALLVVLVLVAPAMAEERWSLSDEAGQRFQASVFEQPYPDYPSGWRLRLNALGAGTELDHADALQLNDATGQTWNLRNRSEEIVPPDGTPVPAGSAQFDLDELTPRPSEALPLQLTFTSAAGPVRIDLTPEQTLTLHDLA